MNLHEGPGLVSGRNRCRRTAESRDRVASPGSRRQTVFPVGDSGGLLEKQQWPVRAPGTEETRDPASRARAAERGGPPDGAPGTSFGRGSGRGRKGSGNSRRRKKSD
ncbi:hypothetical protein STXM2123_1919 [Streptomyces sp. F-3]|nr:hypothetical protein STXM2123_1919 [Streptomyces sp. F-3]